MDTSLPYFAENWVASFGAPLMKVNWREVFKFLSGATCAGSIANFYLSVHDRRPTRLTIHLRLMASAILPVPFVPSPPCSLFEDIVEQLDRRLAAACDQSSRDHMPKQSGAFRQDRHTDRIKVPPSALFFGSMKGTVLKYERPFAAVLATIERRVARLLQRRGLANGDEGNDGPDAWAEEAQVFHLAG
jgi:hypothetical protein